MTAQRDTVVLRLIPRPHGGGSPHPVAMPCPAAVTGRASLRPRQAQVRLRAPARGRPGLDLCVLLREARLCREDEVSERKPGTERYRQLRVHGDRAGQRQAPERVCHGAARLRGPGRERSPNATRTSSERDKPSLRRLAGSGVRTKPGAGRGLGMQAVCSGMVALST